jgi:O-antigen/teichoic acid export membrane protein
VTRSVGADEPIRGLSRQFSWLFIARLGGAGLQAVTLLLLAREVTLTEFGIVNAVIGVGMVASAFTDFGVGAFLTKLRAANPGDAKLADAVRVNRASAVGISVAGAALLLLLGLTKSEIYLALLPLVLWIAAEKVTEALLSFAVADGDTLENTISVIFRRTTGLLVFILLVWAGIDGVFSYCVAQAVSGTLGAGLALHRLGERVPSFSGGNPFRILRESWPFWINTAAAQVRNLDVTVVAMVGGAGVAGVYAVPSRLTTPLRLIPTTLAQIALPAASRGGRGSMKALLRAVAIVMALMTVVLGAIALAADWLVSLLGSEYSDAAIPLRILCGGLLFASLASFMNSILQGRGLQNWVATTSTITGVGSLAGVAVGAWLGGAVGAVLGLALSFVVQVALLAVPTCRIIMRDKRESEEK